ncbi:HAD-IA family hydrolase [Patescibacteria group bacterium]|nr:HAD-IA family hydrolase [Patescibacteria group bacterium]MBU4511775.1 HAD-IA family hydrolase [Patescibacteria group bacterium]
MAVKAVIFDIGGVLAHNVWDHLLLDDNGVMSRFPQLHKAELERIGKVLWDAFGYVPEYPNTWQELEERYWKMFIRYFKGYLPETAKPDDFIQMTDSFIRPILGMKSVLKKLQLKGIKLAICSNNNEFWFRRQMDQLGLWRFFDSDNVILSCRIGVSKSSPRFEMFHAALSALSLPGDNCIFVDDREGNIERARQCGMQGILFLEAEQLDSKLKKLGL